MGCVSPEISSYSPDARSKLSGKPLLQFGRSYKKRIRKLSPEPARIIHTRRDPTDTCLFCFSNLFAGQKRPYTYDLAELGRYYRAYETLMAHWRNVLQPGIMLNLPYEDVDADPDRQTRRILVHCGLEWDARCLEFHKTERQVRTASLAQVRQPVFNSSVDSWRAYERRLGPWFDALELRPHSI